MMKLSLGGIVGVVGGLITGVGALLPWATVSGGTLTSPLTFLGVTAGFGGILVLIFGILGIVFVAMPKKVGPILGIVWGILALLFVLLVIAVLANLGAQYGGSGVVVTTNYGVYVSLVGSLVLIVGSALAFIHARKAAAPAGMPMPPVP